MAKVGAQRAADLTGKSKSTIQRAMNSGKLSYEIDPNNRRIIDVSELERVFGLDSGAVTEVTSQKSVEAEIHKASEILEVERMKMRIRMLEDQLDTAKDQIEDLKAQRDQWQRQAQQVLITSEYSQRQADEYKDQLRQREERARARRSQMLDEKMKHLHGQNENAPAQGSTSAQGQEKGNFSNIWQKFKGDKKAAG